MKNIQLIMVIVMAIIALSCSRKTDLDVFTSACKEMGFCEPLIGPGAPYTLQPGTNRPVYVCYLEKGEDVIFAVFDKDTFDLLSVRGGGRRGEK